jgi:hypothetical protein
MGRSKGVDIYEYRYYRAFLKECYRRGRASGRLSLRSFSQRANQPPFRSLHQASSFA